MVAKMLLLAVSASAALASASARTLKQGPIPGAVAFATAFQESSSFDAENSAEGTTEADTTNFLSEAFADAEGFAGDVSNPIGSGNFADAETIARSDSEGVNNLVGVPDAQSFANSRARSDNGARSDALAEARSLPGIFIEAEGATAFARADGYAQANLFAGASTDAEAFGANNADAISDSVALSISYASSDASSNAFAVNGDSDAIALAVADTDGYNPDGYSEATSDAVSNAERGGDANSFARSRGYDNQNARAESRAESTSASGVATSRATSFAAGGLQVVPVPPVPTPP